MMKFNERLKGLRIQNSMTQRELGTKIGVSEVTIRNWESGNKMPSMQALISLSNIFDSSSDYLLGISNHTSTLSPITKSESDLLKNYRELDYYGRKMVSKVCQLELERVTKYSIDNEDSNNDNITYIKQFVAPAAAGYAAAIEGDDYELVPMDGTVPKTTDFAVKIQGDSMSPYINDGDIVYVKQSDSKLNVGDVGIFCVDGSTYCKIFYEDDNNNITLISANPDRMSSNIYIPGDSNISITCFGKVLLKEKIPFPNYFN